MSLERKTRVPRSVRDRHQKLHEAERALQESLGRKPNDSELAEVLELSIGIYRKCEPVRRLNLYCP